MEFNLIGRIIIKCPKRERVKSVFLTIGIICCLLSIILGVVIHNYFSISFVVPLLFLVRLRTTVSVKERLKDVLVTLKRDENTVLIILRNLSFVDGKTYDLEYEYDDPNATNILFYPQGKVVVEGNYALYGCTNQNRMLKEYGDRFEIIFDNDGVQMIKCVFGG